MVEESRILRLENITHTAMNRLDPEKTMVMAAISPLEVHGPHLPIGQDWFEARALMDKTVEKVAAERTDWTFLILPPLPLADDCLPHLGSVNMPAPLVAEVAFRYMLPFAKHGFKRISFSSFHGGPRHMTSLEFAADRLSREFGVAACSMFSAVVARMVAGDNVFFDGVKDHPDNRISLEQIGQDWHAGFVETSLGLHLWPELVEDGWENMPASTKPMEERKDGDHGTYFMGESASLKAKIDKAMQAITAFKSSIEYYSKHTYSGYPGLSSAELGAAMFEHLADVSRDIINEFIDKGTDMDLHTPLWNFRNVLLSPAVNWVLSEKLGLYKEKKKRL